MPDILIRNLPPVLHARLKAAAASHGRSITKEAIATLEAGLRGPAGRHIINLPEPIPLKGPLPTAEQTQRFIDEDIEARGY